MLHLRCVCVCVLGRARFSFYVLCARYCSMRFVIRTVTVCVRFSQNQSTLNALPMSVHLKIHHTPKRV